MRRVLVLLALLVASAASAAETTLYTAGIQVTGTDHFNCELLNAGKKDLDVTMEIRVVTSPPPDFLTCKIGGDTIPPGRISGDESDPVTCAAAGYFYGVFTFKGKAKDVRAFCWVPEAPAQRVEAR